MEVCRLHDDYSAYMDQELLSAVDGLTHNNSNEYCNHIFIAEYVT